jgi:SpoVK/Ycf46/Vps4 family AAA+-type ATPase
MMPLSPTQERTAQALEELLPLSHVFVVRGSTGMGKSTILRHLHERLGGAFLTTREFLPALRGRHPLALEETFEEWVLQALEKHAHVFVDDLHLLTNVASGCGAYPRPGLFDIPLSTLAAFAEDHKRKLCFAIDGHIPGPLDNPGYSAAIFEFTPDDYAFLCRCYLGDELAAHLDYAKIHRFATRLNAHQLKGVSLCVRRDPELDTERFIEYLRTHHLASNVDLQEVQPVKLSDLHGVADVVESLEANIILPLENDALTAELGLKPKRGVLLLGPPGTGKTTVGRALAHRLKSKFFLLDGTCISGTDGFYRSVHWLFHEARANAPSVLFIDDSDVIFEGGEEMGLYRYLLTMLDGLESASASRVCVMMTAMQVSNLPPALLRSGRIELWLEMKLPDEAARAAILQHHLRPRSPLLANLDIDNMVEATDGFTGADLKRLAEDGKLLLAQDLARGRPPLPPTEYFLQAVANLKVNKQRYAEAEARAFSKRPERPVYFSAVGSDHDDHDLE